MIQTINAEIEKGKNLLKIAVPLAWILPIFFLLGGIASTIRMIILGKFNATSVFTGILFVIVVFGYIPIQAGKQIFNKRLDKLALSYIAESNNDQISDEISSLAKSILNKGN